MKRFLLLVTCPAGLFALGACYALGFRRIGVVKRIGKALSPMSRSFKRLVTLGLKDIPLELA